MVNKDQLEQTSEGQQVLALIAKNFTAEQFQPALTLIEQRYTEDLTVRDAELNSDSKLPFSRTTSAQRLLVFFAGPDRLAKIKDELEQREAEHAIKQAEGPAGKVPATARPKPKAKGKTKPKVGRSAQKARGRKVEAAKAVKKKPLRLQRSNPPNKRRKQKSLPAKTQKSRAKKNRKVSKRKRS
jgi:hypothetical protein